MFDIFGIRRRFNKARRRAKLIKQTQRTVKQKFITSGQMHEFWMYVFKKHANNEMPYSVYRAVDTMSQDARDAYNRASDKLSKLREGLDWEYV